MDIFLLERYLSISSLSYHPSKNPATTMTTYSMVFSHSFLFSEVMVNFFIYLCTHMINQMKDSCQPGIPHDCIFYQQLQEVHSHLHSKETHPPVPHRAEVSHTGLLPPRLHSHPDQSMGPPSPTWRG